MPHPRDARTSKDHLWARRRGARTTGTLASLAMIAGMQGCGDWPSIDLSSDCPDTRQASVPIDAAKVVPVFTPANLRIRSVQGKWTMSSMVGVGLTSTESTSVNFLPSLDSNGLALSVNGRDLRFSPINVNAGGIHGACPELQYPTTATIDLMDSSTTSEWSISLHRGQTVLRQWKTTLSIDTSSLPLLSDTASSDSTLRVSVSIRDRNRRYALWVQDDWNVSYRFQTLRLFPRDTTYVVDLRGRGFAAEAPAGSPEPRNRLHLLVQSEPSGISEVPQPTPMVGSYVYSVETSFR